MRVLNETDKNKARRMIEEYLSLVPDGIKISLNKELLESLIFETRMSENGVIKYPIWTGSFLQKIDLHEISFENVEFDAFKALKNGIVFCHGLNEYLIDFSYTNVFIDFSKTASSSISNCNLSHVNLLNSNASRLTKIETTDLSYTGAKFNLDDNNYHYFANSNLTGLDFSSFQIDSKLLFEFEKIAILNTNLTNTSIKINHTNSEYDKILYANINDGNLNGCYVDGKLVYSNRPLRKENDYEQFKNEIFSSISNSFQTFQKTFDKK